MPIEFVCSQCHSDLRVREQDAGKKARCPRCGMIHDVPPLETELLEELSEVEAAEQETVYHEPTNSSQFQISGYERWLLRTPDGQVYGPVDREELDSWKNEGRISAACLLRAEAQSHWESALAMYPELASFVEPRQTPSHHGGHPYGHRDWVGTRTSSVPGASPRSSFARPNNGGAVLVMGILGMIFVFVPIFALIAWSMGYSERRAMARGEASSRFRWMVDTGYVLGIIGSIIGCLTFFSCCLRFGVS